MNAPRPLTEEERQAIRQHHLAYVGRKDTLCRWCEEEWPCSMIRLLDLLEQAERERDASTEQWRACYAELATAHQDLAERLEQSERRVTSLLSQSPLSGGIAASPPSWGLGVDAETGGPGRVAYEASPGHPYSDTPETPMERRLRAARAELIIAYDALAERLEQAERENEQLGKLYRAAMDMRPLGPPDPPELLDRRLENLRLAERLEQAEARAAALETAAKELLAAGEYGYTRYQNAAEGNRFLAASGRMADLLRVESGTEKRELLVGHRPPSSQSDWTVDLNEPESGTEEPRE